MMIQLLERVVAKEDIEKAASNEEIEQKHNTTCSNENFDECLFSTLIQDMKDKTTENCTAPFITGYHNGNPTTFLMIKCYAFNNLHVVLANLLILLQDQSERKFVPTMTMSTQRSGLDIIGLLTSKRIAILLVAQFLQFWERKTISIIQRKNKAMLAWICTFLQELLFQKSIIFTHFLHSFQRLEVMSA